MELKHIQALEFKIKTTKTIFESAVCAVLVNIIYLF